MPSIGSPAAHKAHSGMASPSLVTAGNGGATPGASPRLARAAPVAPCCCGLSVMGVIRLCFLVALICSVLVGAFYFDRMKTVFLDTLEFVHELGPLRGSVVLCVANIIGALLMMPCVPFTLGAGFLYGTLYGSLVVSVASTVAAVVAFLAARYLARNWIEAQIAAGGESSKFRLVDSAVHKDGFRIVLLIRSSPVHPYGVCNYLFGLTSVTLRDYTLASFIGMLPTTIMEVYFGTAIQNVTDIISGNLHNSVLSRVFFWVGLALSIVATVAITVRMKRLLRTELDKYQSLAVEEGELDDAELEEDDALFGLSTSVRSSPAARGTALEMVEPDTFSSDTDAVPMVPAVGSEKLSRSGSADSRRNSEARRAHGSDTSPGASSGNSSRRIKSCTVPASAVQHGASTSTSPHTAGSSSSPHAAPVAPVRALSPGLPNVAPPPLLPPHAV